MHKRIIKSACAIAGITLIGMSVGTRSNAQVTRSSSNRPGSPGAQAANVLDSDARLKLKVTIERKNTTIEKAFSVLSKLTQVKMQAGEPEIAISPVAFRYNSVSLKEIFDSLAVLHGWRWKRDSNKVWILYSPLRMNALRPRNEHQAETYRLGQQFLDQMSQLSDAQKSALWIDGTSNDAVKSVPLSSLPENMQQTVQQMIASDGRDSDALGEPRPPAIKSILEGGNLNVFLQGNRHEDHDSYSVTVGNGRGGIGMSFLAFHDPQEDYHVVSLEDRKAMQWSPGKDDALSRQEAIQKDPALSTRVTVNMKDVTLAEALTLLSSKLNIPFLLDNVGRPPARRNITLPDLPLHEAIDRLCSLYDRTVRDQKYAVSWGHRKSGVLIFHWQTLEQKTP